MVYFAYGFFLIYSKSGYVYKWGWLMVGIGIFILCFIYPVYYKITSVELIIRSGLIRWSIPFANIVEIFPTNSPTAVPAWSRDRLQISYTERGKKHFVLISPERKGSFLNEITQKMSKFQTPDKERFFPNY